MITVLTVSVLPLVQMPGATLNARMWHDVITTGVLGSVHKYKDFQTVSSSWLHGASQG